MKITDFILLAGMPFLMVCACGNQTSMNIAESPSSAERPLQKYEPEQGKCYLFVGQDLGAVGGMEDYSDGYCDYFDVPAGITVYLGLAENGEVAGLYGISDWGSGDCSADMYAKSEKFDNCMFAIGLAMVRQEEKIVQGVYDESIDLIGKWIKGLAPRPVFLRIGYEFDGKDWNGYKPETYVPAFRYIKDRLDAAGVSNIAYVWQSKGTGTPWYEFRKFYPGDEYVDWCAYSYFDSPDKEMIRFARSKGKPVIIAESTPTFKDADGNYTDSDIKKPEIARKIWDKWMTGLFDTIEENDDVVKAVAYINVDWYTQPMWIGNITFQQCDSRIQKSDYVSRNWQRKVSEPRFVHADDLEWNIIKDKP